MILIDVEKGDGKRMRFLKLSIADGECGHSVNLVVNVLTLNQILEIVVKLKVKEITIVDPDNKEFLVKFDNYWEQRYKFVDTTDEDDKRENKTSFTVFEFDKELNEWFKDHWVTITDKGVITESELKIVKKFVYVKEVI